MRRIVLRRWRLAMAIVAIGIAVLLGWMFALARSMPVVKYTTVHVAYPDGVARRPVRIALISDTHVSDPGNPPGRMRRIMQAVNAQKPDLVLLAGDFLGNDRRIGSGYSIADSIRPFADLRAPLGVLAVMGNHDYWYGAGPYVKQELRRAGVTVLTNEAVSRGPLAIGGVDDLINGQPKLRKTIDAVGRLKGVPILVAHEPDIFVLAPDFGPLMLVGHTHCGQVSFPLVGVLWMPSRVANIYPCGRYDESGRTLIVGGGIGTSALPIRLGVPPEYWIITIVPK